MIGLHEDELKKMYHFLVLTRKLDEKICELYAKGGIPEKPMSAIGQEATAVGAALALEPGDYAAPSLRSRGAFLTKGMSAEEMLAEIYKKQGCKSEGRWMAHHMGDMNKGIVMGSGIVGSSVTIAAGVALASKIKKSGQVTMAFFGDGASSRGDVHEAMNFAAVRQLPIVFVCEHNKWALGTTSARQMKNQNVSDRAMGYGIPGERIDGQDILEVYFAAQRAVHRARRGDGPTLLECKTYHYRGHSESHAPDDGRPKAELDYWRSRCPVAIFKNYLTADGRLAEADMKLMDERIDREIGEAVDKVLALPDVNPTLEELQAYLYA